MYYQVNIIFHIIFDVLANCNVHNKHEKENSENKRKKDVYLLI